MGKGWADQGGMGGARDANLFTPDFCCENVICGINKTTTKSYRGPRAKTWPGSQEVLGVLRIGDGMGMYLVPGE